MSVPTWDVLISLGFRKNRELISDSYCGLSFHFGNFKLDVTFGMNRYLRDVALFYGITSTPRSFGEAEWEMPQEVDSCEQGVAWVTWGLDKYVAHYGTFKPTLSIPWLIEGRQNRHLLPWERRADERAAKYAAMPKCWVKHEWAKMALRNLSEILETLNKTAMVTFQFDGEILTVRYIDSVIAAMPALGDKWHSEYSIKAERLQALPKRLRRGDVGFLISDSVLIIGNNHYPGVVADDLKSNGDKP